jgi:hypothetical protein
MPTSTDYASNATLMDPTQQTAAEYYKRHRKRSLFSRITILSSMTILLIVLAVNISILYSQDTSTVKSNASTHENIEQMLPSLPAGCQYQHVGNNVIVDCPKASPTAAVKIPINVVLPELPPQCSFVSSTDGSAIQCTASHIPIPTVPVNLPSTCTVEKEPNTVTCTNGNNQTVTVSLPKIPDGCSYFLGANKYYVVCDQK